MSAEQLKEKGTQRESSENMATSDPQSSSLKEINDQTKLVLSTVTEIKSNQDSMRRSFDSKLDKMKNEFMATIDGKLRTLRDEIAMEISTESNRIDNLMTSLQNIQSRLEAVERPDYHEQHMEFDVDHRPRRATQTNLDDPEICITANGLPFDREENLIEKANELIRALGIEVSSKVVITGATKLKPRFDGKPGLVKISLRNVEEKVLVLRHKRNLKDSAHYKDVYIKSSKSHAERLIELNARTILRQIPQGNNFWVDSNGRIRPRQKPENASGNQ